MKNWSLLGGAMLALGVASSAQASHTSVIFFSDPSGLSARAKFELVNNGNTIVVTLLNTSTGAPVGFTNVDELLSGIAFDLGAPGVNPSDPSIVNGTVTTGAGSYSINFSIVSVGPGEDVSGEYEFGNAGTPVLRPNFISSMEVGGLHFVGTNLDANLGVAGPEAGLVSGLASIPLSGVGAIQNEIVMELNLDQPLTDMQFLPDNGVGVGFGASKMTVDGNCDHDSYSRATPDSAGFNAPNSLFPMGIPSIGNPNYKVCMDEAANQCGITPGSLTFVAFSPGTASVLIPNFGCTPGNPGELMIDVTLPHTVLGPLVWTGPGSPVCHSMPVPPDPSLCRTVCFGQGVFRDSFRLTGPYIFTNRLDFVIGV